MPAASTFTTYDRGRNDKDFSGEDQRFPPKLTEMTKSATHLSGTMGHGSGASRPRNRNTDKAEFKTAAEQAVCEMDIPEHLVRLAVQIHLLETGELHANVQQLYLEALDIASNPDKQAMLARKLHQAEISGRSSQHLDGEVAEEGAESAQTVAEFAEAMDVTESSDATPEIAPVKTDCGSDDTATSKTENSKTTELREKVLDLMKENQKLTRRKKCRLCTKIDLSSSGVTFLPCGHFITCEECAEKCDDCPACGRNIMGTVRTFLS